MKNTTYLIIGLFLGYMLALFGTQTLNATTFQLGSKFNPMHVIIVGG